MLKDAIRFVAARKLALGRWGSEISRRDMLQSPVIHGLAEDEYSFRHPMTATCALRCGASDEKLHVHSGVGLIAAASRHLEERWTMEKDRKKVRALYVFEVVIVAYLACIFGIQLWLVYWR